MSTAISTAPKQEFIKTINESQDLFDVTAACYYFIITSNEQKMTDDSSFIARFNSF